MKQSYIVVGSEYQDKGWVNLATRAAGKGLANATLVREPNNPHDKNAIAVMFDGNRIGYLSAYQAARYKGTLPTNARLSTDGSNLHVVPEDSQQSSQTTRHPANDRWSAGTANTSGPIMTADLYQLIDSFSEDGVIDAIRAVEERENIGYEEAMALVVRHPKFQNSFEAEGVKFTLKGTLWGIAILAIFAAVSLTIALLSEGWFWTYCGWVMFITFGLTSLITMGFIPVSIRDDKERQQQEEAAKKLKQ